MTRYPCWSCFWKIMRDWVARKLPQGWMRRGYKRIHFHRCFGWALRWKLA